jgi:hypothetical protein
MAHHEVRKNKNTHTEFGIKEGRDVDKAVCILKRFKANR